MNKKYSYDAEPFPSSAYIQSHPDRLAVIATLFGMKPAPIESAKILELGCADGANIVPIAYNLPNTHITGIDLSKVQVDNGKRCIQDLKLSNIKIEKKDILKIKETLGKFDYIIAHGIYSWVSEAVRNKILHLCKALLKPEGVAYISYNTYPGKQMHERMRDMVLYHTRHFNKNDDIVNQAKAFSHYLAEEMKDVENPYSTLMQAEAEAMSYWPNNYMYHDLLEEVNKPCYFHEFNDMAQRHDLQYLGDANFSTMVAENYKQTTQEMLKKLSTNIIDLEQYMDFISNRQFRSTILCHKEVKLNRTVNIDRMKDFYISTKLLFAQNESNKNEMVFKDNVRTVGVQNALTSEAIKCLIKRYPTPIKLDELIGMLSIKSDSDKTTIADFIISGYAKNLVNLHQHKPVLAKNLDEKPKVDDFVKYCVEHGKPPVNQYHEVIALDPMSIKLIPLLDGTRTQQDLVRPMEQALEKGELHFEQPPKEPQQVILGEIAKRLLLFYRHALLVP